MSRFSPARTGAIAVWTGAMIAWSTALVAGPLQPSPRADEFTSEESSVAIDSESRAGLPQMPDSGLVILRSVAAPSGENVQVVARPPQPPSETKAPEPVSSGS
jgi:hypothetical protein